MSPLALALRTLRTQGAGTLLYVLLLALGTATIVLLLIAGHGLGSRLERNAAGIDLVIGAKGSPMQLILSSLYHADVPTGNIPLAEAERFQRHRLVAQAVPLALGDSHAGFRIVGSTADYPALYGAALARGRWGWGPLEATLGAEVARATGLGPGDRFVGSHGLVGGGAAHDEAPYTVAGVLAPSGTVLDRLVLVSVETVWAVHAPHRQDHEHEHAQDNAGKTAGAEAAAGPPREITALLVRYATPLAAALLPRQVNARSSLQAAAPALETARLMNLVGFGVETLRALALVLVAASALGIFIALWTTLGDRRHELAVMRTLGASRGRLFGQLVLEGALLALAGGLLGLALGHTGAEALGRMLPALADWGVGGLAWAPAEIWVLPGALALGVLAALPPAWRAARTDIASTLSAGR